MGKGTKKRERKKAERKTNREMKRSRKEKKAKEVKRMKNRETEGKKKKNGGKGGKKGERKKGSHSIPLPANSPLKQVEKVVSRPHLVDKAPGIGKVQEKPCR